MATLWRETSDGYVRGPLQAVWCAAENGCDVGRGTGCELRFVGLPSEGRVAHALLAPERAPVRVNGSLLVGGLRVLRHQDELWVGGQRLFYSAESRPKVEAYRHYGEGRLPRCPICRAEVCDGQPSVCCPGCSRRYHQIEAADEGSARACWTYSSECRFCDHPTSLDGESSWRSESEARAQAVQRGRPTWRQL